MSILPEKRWLDLWLDILGIAGLKFPFAKSTSGCQIPKLPPLSVQAPDFFQTKVKIEAQILEYPVTTGFF